MSHFSVLVCLPADTELSKLEAVLDDVMGRWDENREVEQYRDYEEDAPDEYWWVRSVRSGARSHARLLEVGAEALAVERIQKHAGRDPHSIATAVKAVKESAAGWAEDARWAVRLGVDPVSDGRIGMSWAIVVQLYNEKWYPPNRLAEVGDSSADDRLYLDEDGRAYTLSTRNPEAKWDYWRIGGRWREYFIAREPGAGIITTRKEWDSREDKRDDRIWCDGAPLGLLDLDAMRDVHAAERLKAYDTWQDIVATLGQPPVWRDLIGLVDLKELEIEDARRQYNSHPAIEAARKAEISGFMSDGPEEMYGTTREEFERLARLEAVPGYALVTLDREWVAPGRMGWFGMSSDGPGEREGYHIAVNKYLDSLRPETLVVVLDSHI